MLSSSAPGRASAASEISLTHFLLVETLLRHYKDISNMEEYPNFPGCSEEYVPLPVNRTKGDAIHLYDRISAIYDYLALSEIRYLEKGVRLLNLKDGDIVLEIGSGTGRMLPIIAKEIGSLGIVCGLDISSGMIAVSKRKLEKERTSMQIELIQGDGILLPFRDSSFSTVFMGFTLELFDTPEIPVALGEIWRVLKPGGKLVVVGLSREKETIPLKLYEWLHKKWPRYFDCRPIYVKRSVKDAKFDIKSGEMHSMFGLPVEIVLAIKPS